MMIRIGSGFLMSTSPLILAVALAMASCSGGASSSAPATAAATGTPGAQEAVGERLFMCFLGRL